MTRSNQQQSKSIKKKTNSTKRGKRGTYINWSLPENQAKLYYLVTTFNNEQDSGKRPSLSAYAENNHIAYKTIQPYCCKNVHERKKIEFKQQSLLDENEITSVCQYVIRENLSLDDPPLILDKLQSQYGNKLLDRKSARNQFYRYIKPKCE